ncbi:ABC transporter substrate-binding protein [Motiliproteus sp. MSK22-1]|nr:ABC transporter substrate-binding protein [Motiliproteus sp. MSK22-1]
MTVLKLAKLVINNKLGSTLLGLLVCSFSWADGEITSCKSLSATGNSEYPPYLWRESQDSKVLFGANRIVMDEIGRRLGIPIELQHTGPWSRAQVEVKAGRIDLMAGAFYTIPRIQYMDYVYPAFLNTTSVVWGKKGRDFVFKSRDDLIPLRGVTVINNSFGQDFDNFAKEKLNIYTVASLEHAFKMVSFGRVDYALYERNPGLAYVKLLKVADTVEVREPAISSEGLYLGISHKSKCNTGALRGQLAKIVQEMIAEGFMQKALDQGLEDWDKFGGK